MLKILETVDQPTGSVVKTLPSTARVVGLIPPQGAMIPTCLGAKKKKNNRSDIVMNPVKTFKMSHIKKNL